MNTDNDQIAVAASADLPGIIDAIQDIGRSGTTTGDLTEQYLQRITLREPTVGAWIHLDPEQARQQALSLNSPTSNRALFSIPIAVKDVFDTADMPTCYGSPIYSGYRPRDDAIAVQRLRAAGAVILGKTVTTEFAHSFPGKTRNPHALNNTPGGSSSGSAAAVAAGLAVAALGTQTSGSVIRPASFCGVVGFKPTFGRIPTTGLKALAKSLDTIGVLARTVGDAAAVARVLWNDIAAAQRPLLDEKPKRVGVCRTQYWDESRPGVEEAIEAAAKILRGAGVAVDEVSLPPACRDLNAAQEQIYAYEASVEFSDLANRYPDKISSDLRELIATGQRIAEIDYRSALDRALKARAAFLDFMESFDFLLTPSAPGEAPDGLRWTGNPVFNRLWTLLHIPCLSLPTARGPKGLPIGVQLIGRSMGDDALLANGHWLSLRMRCGGR